jgi:hypothetical protein
MKQIKLLLFKFLPNLGNQRTIKQFVNASVSLKYQNLLRSTRYSKAIQKECHIIAWIVTVGSTQGMDTISIWKLAPPIDITGTVNPTTIGKASIVIEGLLLNIPEINIMQMRLDTYTVLRANARSRMKITSNRYIPRSHSRRRPS